MLSFIIATYSRLIIKIMEVNKPDRGIFKGMGKLEIKRQINRKYFPMLRNQHQFDYTHSHTNDYKTSFQAFKPFQKKDYGYQRVKTNGNKSHFQLGTDSKFQKLSENKYNYRKHDSSVPPKPCKQPQEGLGINQYASRTGENVKYCTTNQQFNSFLRDRSANNKNDISYKYTRTQKFNPITGQSKSSTNYGFEDYVPSRSKSYKANNYSVVPRAHQKFDIISGRKLTYC